MQDVRHISDKIVKTYSLAKHLQTEPFSTLWSIWHDKQIENGNRMPKKSQFSPIEMKSILPILAIFECDLPDKVTVRLSGTEIDERNGANMNGINMLDVLPQDEARKLIAMVKQILNHPCGYISVTEQEFSNGKKKIVESLFLPVGDEDNNPRYLISVHKDHGRSDLLIKGRPIVANHFTNYAEIDLGHGIPG